LVNNTTNEQIEIKKAAMMTLGYICEALVRTYLKYIIKATSRKEYN